jgi:phosphoglycerate dehydrogenase-like enzyme
VKQKAALFYNYPMSDGEVFDSVRREQIADMTELYPHVVHAGNFDEHASQLAETEVIFATWGMPALSDEQFAQLPKLQAVFYAAGNVKAFAEPLLDHDVILVSAWQANAIPASEMCLSQTLLSLRGYFRSVRGYRAHKTHAAARNFHRTGVADETVGLIGLGKIASLFREKLRDYPLQIIVHDPFLSAERASEMDVESVSLEQVFERALVVSNHTPDNVTTRAALRREHFQSMRNGATFINSGRGAQVVEADLIAVLSARDDLTALLDVTDPEPPIADSPLWALPNVVISPHIGGTIGNEVVRLSDLMIEEYQRWRDGSGLRYQVTREVFATMG